MVGPFQIDPLPGGEYTTMQLYRQGDVLFRRIQRLPAGEQKRRRNATLAYGEVTGHSHAVALEDRDHAEVLDIGDGLYLTASAAGIRIVHQEHDTVVLPRGHYEVTIQREYHPSEIRNVAD